MIPFQGTNFLTYQYLKNNYTNTTVNLLTFGCISGITSVSVSYPFDVIKRRLQLSNELGNPQYKNTVNCLIYIYNKFGVQGFYKGLLPCYLKIIPANCIFFYTIETFKSLNT